MTLQQLLSDSLLLLFFYVVVRILCENIKCFERKFLKKHVIEKFEKFISYLFATVKTRFHDYLKCFSVLKPCVYFVVIFDQFVPIS